MPIDNLVLPPNVSPMFQHPGDHSSDDEDDGYHPIHATSTDGKEASFNNDDTWPANDYDMKENLCLGSHQEPPSDIIDGDSGINAVGNSSPNSHQVLPSLETSSSE